MSESNIYYPFKLWGHGEISGVLLTDMKWDSFEKLGYLGNGYDWARMLENLLEDIDSDLLKNLNFDPEADMFSASANNKDLLKQFSEIVANFYDNTEMLENYIEKYAKYE